VRFRSSSTTASPRSLTRTGGESLAAMGSPRTNGAF
jgi:hypothetical protein